MNLDKLTAFLEELRVSRSRTVSIGTLMCARDASAADKTHLAEVRHCCRARLNHRCTAVKFMHACEFENFHCNIALPGCLLLVGNQWLQVPHCVCIAASMYMLHGSQSGVCFALAQSHCALCYPQRMFCADVRCDPVRIQLGCSMGQVIWYCDLAYALGQTAGQSETQPNAAAASK